MNGELEKSAFSIYKKPNKHLKKPKNTKLKKKQTLKHKLTPVKEISLPNSPNIKKGPKAKKRKADNTTVATKDAKKKNIVSSPSLITQKTKNNVCADAKDAVISNGIKEKIKSLSTKDVKKKLKALNKEFEEIADEQDNSPVVTDSVEEGKKLFSWLISPLPIDEFISNMWEKKPIHISRDSETFYKNIISTPIIDKLLRTENILFSKNIDITSYENEKRETHNPIGRALPHVVWDFYLNGCSVRLLNPQTYIPRLHLLNATLQEYFSCFVGANSYLTPPDSQGFAPHYDDIEAFILQIEGKKHWKVYAPVSKEEVLPRTSSKNFLPSEIGDPILEVTLSAGDLLYFPRGFIHQAVTVDGEHSLHVTLSCYQKNSWADLFELMIPQALEMAIKSDEEFRGGLPLDISRHLGVVHSDSSTSEREKYLTNVKKLFKKVSDFLNVDGAVDQLAKKFMHDALPPVITENEKQLTVFGDSDVMTKNGKVKDRVEMQLDTKIRLLRANILRIVMEEETIRLYYYIENSKEYHGNDPQFFEINESLASGVETLITMYPEYVTVEQLELQNDIEKIEIATVLWEKGIIMTEEPLEFIE